MRGEAGLLVRREDPGPTVILCGGQNTRMQALSGTVYKAFLPLHGTTLVARHILRAVLGGVTDITVIVDARDPMVAAHVEATAAELRGAAAITLEHVKGETAEKLRFYDRSRGLDGKKPVIVILGDSYSWYDPAALVAAAGRPADSAMTVARYVIPYGVVGVVDHMVRAFDEKPESGYLINAGQLALGDRAFQLLNQGMGLAGVLSELAATGLLAAVEVDSPFVSIDTLHDIATVVASGVLME